MMVEEKSVLLETDTVEKPMAVLFVCTGNTCRSPMAAAVLNDLAARVNQKNPPYRAMSAGLYANDGELMSQGARTALERAKIGGAHGVHRACTVNEGLLAACDVIVGISSRHAMALMQAFPQFASKITVMKRDIADPFGQDDEVYDRCLEEITECVKEMFTLG
ncbi:MAG: hypothetical protein IJA85_03855 [Clostridia bacterium]|nr:hypothetical protein [Clostridia bacterium]